jgi:uncharacterized membrane protein
MSGSERWRLRALAPLAKKPRQRWRFAMSDLLVLDFDGTGTADEVLTKLRSMQKEHLIDLEDACVVVHTEDGKLQIKQAMNLAALGAASGASTGVLIGALAGLLFLNPLAGIAVGGLAGAGFGGLSGAMADYGINDEFIKNLGKTMPFEHRPSADAEISHRLCRSWLQWCRDPTSL